MVDDVLYMFSSDKRRIYVDRRGQLRNVAFGGAWSEQIEGNERLAEAMAQIDAAVQETAERDVRQDQRVAAALDAVCAAHPKGGLLREAWRKALDQGAPVIRTAELARISAAIRAGLGARLK